MLKEIFSIINPLDAVILVVLARILYIGVRRGPLAELFKLLGVFFATFIALHYYLRLAKMFNKFIAISPAANDVLAFLLIVLVVMGVFKILREGVLLLLGKKEEKPSSVPWVAIFLAAIRGALVGSLIFVAILLTGVSAWVQVAQQARSAVVLRSLAVGIYQGLYEKVVVRLFPSEELNEYVLAFQDPEYLAK